MAVFILNWTRQQHLKLYFWYSENKMFSSYLNPFDAASVPQIIKPKCNCHKPKLKLIKYVILSGLGITNMKCGFKHTCCFLRFRGLGMKYTKRPNKFSKFNYSISLHIKQVKNLHMQKSKIISEFSGTKKRGRKRERESTLSAKRFFLLLFRNRANWNSSCQKKLIKWINKVTNQINHNYMGISGDGIKVLIQKSFTLWIRPSLMIEKLNFLNNSYNASTSLTVTASNKMARKHSITKI